MNVMQWFTNAKRTLTVFIGQQVVTHYLRVMGKIMVEEIQTAKEILDDPSVEKLVVDVAAAINQNKEGLISLKAHFQKFMVRVEDKLENDESKEVFEFVNKRIAEIWE